MAAESKLDSFLGHPNTKTRQEKGNCWIIKGNGPRECSNKATWFYMEDDYCYCQMCDECKEGLSKEGVHFGLEDSNWIRRPQVS